MSHTPSTAAGRAVGNISFGGVAAGVARGEVPGARLAIYKVCWDSGSCRETDMLAAFDDAIADAVDVISISIGYRFPIKYFNSALAIGSFHAMRRGVRPHRPATPGSAAAASAKSRRECCPSPPAASTAGSSTGSCWGTARP